MAKPKGFEKPAGVRDYLPHIVAKLRHIEMRVLDCMRRWGYEQIMTPTMEYYDTVGVASATSDSKLFKLLNNRGMTLVLRSDMTAPIARVAASLLRDAPLPLRLSYHANVFRSIEEEAGREAEFFQTGVELIGDPSPDADAEVVALAIASLQAAGVERFKIAIGHVGFLNGLLREKLSGDAEAQEELKAHLLRRDHVGYRERLRSLGLPPQAERDLEDILRLRGGRETCRQAKELSPDPAARQAMDHLCAIWDVLDAYGVTEHVLIDLTMIGDFSYYTGMTFEGYAADLGFPVASGGRYDNLLAQFGRPAPATGFALKTTRILDLVDGGADDTGRGRVLIGYDAAGRNAALAEAGRLRAEGLVAVTARMTVAEAEALERSRRGDGPIRYNGAAYERFERFFGPAAAGGDGGA